MNTKVKTKENKAQNENYTQNQAKKGISLIVLVITIIVIVILAVAVILTLANNNPIENANKASFQNDLKAMEEEVNLYETDKYTEANITGGTYTPTTVEGENMVDMFPSTSNYEDKVKVENGKLVIIEDALTEKEKEWASEIGFTTGGEGDNIEDDEDIEDIPIPKGFVASQATGENTKAGGLVIYEGTEEVTDENVETARTTRNQFVWVPVPEGTFVREDGYSSGTQQTYVSSKKATEPLNYNGTTASQSEEDEYNAMYASVEKYGGFYIGRYEASDNGSGVAQSKKNQAPWVNIEWGNSMTDLNGGAVEKARAVYPDSTSKQEGEAVSTLIYGVQWDATVRWLEENYPGIAKGSTDHGNYNTDSEINTGSNNAYKLNNIYDLAGNVYEWTMEASNSYTRVSRGGAYFDPGSRLPVSNRSHKTPASSGRYFGFRFVLCIK